VDPLLRENIWLHLREIAASGVTVIITTHYIEEARMAGICYTNMNKHINHNNAVSLFNCLVMFNNSFESKI